MKFSAAVFALSAATLAYAQDISDLPSCALNCFIGPLQSDGCESLTDFKCHCSKPDLLPKVVPCVESKCPADVAAQVGEQAVALCKSYGVDITLPSSGGESTPPPSEESSSAAESSYPTGGESTAASASATATISTYPVPSGNSTASASTYAPAPTNAANKATFGGAVAVAAGVAALAGL